MTYDLNSYPAYRDSGVAWLGDVPEHWNMLRAKFLFKEVDIRSGTGSEPHLCMSQKLGLVESDQIEQKRLQSESYVGGKICTKNDLVLNRLKAHLGVFAHVKQGGLVSPDYSVYRLHEEENEIQFFEQVLRSPKFVVELRRSTKGIVEGFWRLYTEDFFNLSIPVPPSPEQTAIIRFLEHADRRIRRAVQAKRKLIALLNEEKQAVIHLAVTRGLEPDVPLKPSGVDWLGDVPAHWDVIALRLRYDQCLGKMLDSKRIKGANLLPYLRNQDVQWDRITTSDLPMMDISPEEYARYTVRPGDLLVCEGGEVGRCAIWKGEITVCGFQKALHRLRPRSKTIDEPRFLFYLMQVASGSGAFSDGHESTIAHLTGDKLRAHRFPFPPNSEQIAIVSHLDDAMTNLDHAIAATKREIDLLLEFRTRLISDVVTGRLDVREAAAGLPDETNESAPLDGFKMLDNEEADVSMKIDEELEEAEA